MPQAIQSCFTNYATFGGRASRSEYWYFALFYVIVDIVANIADAAAGTFAFDAIAVVVFLLPSLAVGARRLHDTGRSAWWLLLVFVPLVGEIVLIIWFATRSREGANRYGPPPHHTDGTTPALA